MSSKIWGKVKKRVRQWSAKVGLRSLKVPNNDVRDNPGALFAKVTPLKTEGLNEMTDFSELTDLILREFHGQKLEDLKNSWKEADKANGPGGISAKTFYKLLSAQIQLSETTGEQEIKAFTLLLTNGVRNQLFFSDFVGFIKSRTVELGMPRWLKRDHTFVRSDDESWTKERALSFLSRNWGKFRELLENEFIDEVVEKSALRKFLLEKFGIYFAQHDFDELWEFLSDGRNIAKTDAIWRKLSSHFKPSSASLQVEKDSSPAVIGSRIVKELSQIDQKAVRRTFSNLDKLKRGKLDRRRFRLALEKLEIKINKRDFGLLAKSELFEKDGETILIEKLLSKTAALNLISFKNQ